jgi:hypothetical protein
MTARLRSLKPAISYSIPEAVDATGLSETVIKDALKSGDLVKHYPVPSKPVILAEDLADWIRNSPTGRVA